MSSNKRKSVHIERIVKFLNFGWGVINPIVESNGKKKFNTWLGSQVQSDNKILQHTFSRFIMFAITQPTFMICFLSYMIAEGANVNLGAFTESSTFFRK